MNDLKKIFLTGRQIKIPPLLSSSASHFRSTVSGTHLTYSYLLPDTRSPARNTKNSWILTFITLHYSCWSV